MSKETKKQSRFQFVFWFPTWIGFKLWKPPASSSWRFIYRWELSLGFFEIRRWETRPYKEVLDEYLRNQ